jgi:hypothetical protein
MPEQYGNYQVYILSLFLNILFQIFVYCNMKLYLKFL